MRIVYFGWDEFGVPVLMSLANRDHEIPGVVTPAGSGASKTAVRTNPVEVEPEELALPVYNYQAADASEVAKEVGSLKAEVGIVAALGEELPDPFRRTFSAGCIGIHPSLLPKYRGRSPISWSILNGEMKTGVTVYRIADRPYAGPILVQRETMILPGETWTELHFRLARIACDAIDAALKTLALNPHFAGEAQDESKASPAPELKEIDGYLRFDEPAEMIALRCRAMWPKPGTLCRYVSKNGEVEHLQIVRATAERGTIQLLPGTITSEFKVATTEGFLQIQEIQPAKERVRSWQEFIRESRVSPGERFEPVPR
jgi:methionyl-tRNA formyltransferase